MPLNDQAAGPRGVVVTYMPDTVDRPSEHELATQAEYARRIAWLLDYETGGPYDPSRRYPGAVYFVPGCTLLGEQAARLGIRGPQDLFGGVVPHAFVATKVISHPLVAPDAAAPPGWNAEFVAQAGDAVLSGFSVFSHDDARRAGLRLLAGGPLRIKRATATGGWGQSVARTAAELELRLANLDAGEVKTHGLVLEENLAETRTMSVGQVTVGELTAAYFGLQRQTRNNRGEAVYGGSDLTVARGDWDALLAQGAQPEVRSAVDQARRYNAAAHACFPGFFASRINYDVVTGLDAAGRSRAGVLEQSWRLGGATGPELAALEVFRTQPGRDRVRAAGVEVFGDSPPPPPHAIVYFRGTDPRAGRLTKYTVVAPDVDTR